MTIDRLSAADRMMLRASTRWPQEIGALAILDGTRLLDADGRVGVEAVRAAIEPKVHLVPRFRQVVHDPGRWLGGPLWMDAPHFDLSEHLRVLPLPDGADEAALVAAAERLARDPLDRSRPLWDMCFMPGLPDGRLGLFVRMHHAIADGTAAMTNVGALLEADPDAAMRRSAPWTPAPVPRAPMLVVDSLRRRASQLGRSLRAAARPWITLRRAIGALPGTREMLSEEPGPKTSLHRLIGPERNVALVRSSIDLLKEIGHTHGATVNDVLLCVVAGGLRALLRSRGEDVPDALPVYVPVSLRRAASGVLQGNRITQMTVWLPLTETDPVARLRQVARATTRVKAKGRPELGTLFRLIPSRMLLKLAAAQRVNVTTANIRGPEVPLYLAGAQVLEVFPVLPLIGTVALGVGGVSYAGAFNLGVVGDRAAYPDIDFLAAAMRDELDLLSASGQCGSGVSGRDPAEIGAEVSA